MRLTLLKSLTGVATTTKSGNKDDQFFVVSFTPLLCLLVLFLSPIVLSLSSPAPTGFTGTQTPTGAAGAPEEDGAAASRAGAGEAAAGVQTPTAQKQGQRTGE